MLTYYPTREVKVESGQYKFVGGNTDVDVTRTITLAHPGKSLDRMELIVADAGGMVGSPFTKDAAVWTGQLRGIYISAVDKLTLIIRDREVIGTSDGFLSWQVKRR